MSTIELLAREWADVRKQISSAAVFYPHADEGDLVERSRRFEAALSWLEPATPREAAILATIMADLIARNGAGTAIKGQARESTQLAERVRDNALTVVGCDRATLLASLLEPQAPGETLIGALAPLLDAAWNDSVDSDVAAAALPEADPRRKKFSQTAERAEARRRDFEHAIASARCQCARDAAMAATILTAKVAENSFTPRNEEALRRLLAQSLAEWALEAAPGALSGVLDDYKGNIDSRENFDAPAMPRERKAADCEPKTVGL